MAPPAVRGSQCEAPDIGTRSTPTTPPEAASERPRASAEVSNTSKSWLDVTYESKPPLKLNFIGPDGEVFRAAPGTSKPEPQQSTYNRDSTIQEYRSVCEWTPTQAPSGRNYLEYTCRLKAVPKMKFEG